MAFYTPPQIDGAYPERVVLDGFKAAVAAQLSRIFAIDLSLAFSAVDLPKKFDTSDLTVPVPRLKVKGKPNELALKAQAEVYAL
jgi:arginyl-tRNA synthetase